MRFLLLIFCFSFAVCKINAVENIVKSADIKATKLISTDDTRSKTGKRDSSGQTGPGAETQKDEPFRPIYRPYYFTNNAGFRPTVANYETAAADSQSYYEKPDSGAAENLADRENGYRATYMPANYNDQHYAQIEETRQHITPAAESNRNYASEPDSNVVYERVPFMHYQHIHPFAAAHRPRLPTQATMQYIIAIPLSYARQLQQQLARIPTHASQAYALPVAQQAAPQAHSLAYRPFQYALHQTPAASLMHIMPSAEASAAGHRFIPISANMLYAAAQAAALSQKPAAYQPVYYTHPQPVYQTAAPQESAHQQSLYAYTTTVGKQQLPEVVRIGGAKSGLKADIGHGYNAAALYVQQGTSAPDQQQQQSIAGTVPAYANAIPLVRISAPRAVLAPQYFTIPQRLHTRPLDSISQKLLHYQVAPSAYPESIVPSSLPYLSQPGAVHYGSHLYHPSLPSSLTTAATKADLQNPTAVHVHNSNNKQQQLQPTQQQQQAQHQHQQQQQQHQQQQQATSNAAVVKYP